MPVLIATFRNQHHLTQHQLAAAIGSPRATLAGYERGLRRVPVATLSQIARIFNISIDALYCADASEANETCMEPLAVAGIANGYY